MSPRLGLSVGITRYWWVPLLTGIICMAFGIWCFVNPVATIEVLAYCFCIGMLLAGVLDIGFAFANRRANLNWGWSLALGLLELIVGGWLLAMPAGALAVGFVYAIGIWIIVVAINSICEAFALSRYTGGAAVWMVLLLIVTVVLAVIFLSDPILGGVAVWLYIGLSLLMFGFYRIALAFSLRKLNNSTGGMI